MIRTDESKSLIFDTLVMNKREQVVYWLLSKYPTLRYDDAEDIFQEAAIAMWQKYRNATEQLTDSIIGLVKHFCCYGYSHWLRKQQWGVEWDDSFYPEDEQVEADYTFISSQEAYLMKKERVFEEIAKMKPEDREFVEMQLEHKTTQEIMQRFDLKNPQVVRNKRCKIVARLRKELNGQALDACPSFFLFIIILVITYYLTPGSMGRPLGKEMNLRVNV